MPTQNADKITAIIVDDELHGRENLKQIIETYCPELEIQGLADSVVAARVLVSRVHPEVVFLDINMPVLDGFDFLEEYDERSFMVVFVSVHEEFGIHALKAGAVDYLMKPISIKELKQTVKKLGLLKQKMQKEGSTTEMDKLVIPGTHGFDVLNIEDILRLEADGCYTTITTKEGKTTIVSRTLKNFEVTLSKHPFFRTHKSHIINLKYIKDFSNLSGNFVTLTDGSKVEISRRKTPDFIQKVKSFLKSV
ncbi:MAG: LytTR family DNA-binding domain-containing protein [Bacteroidales bacterium]|nr:LytTR family DNA-binding domain-containing protein [Bacteroidales bacterium]